MTASCISGAVSKARVFSVRTDSREQGIGRARQALGTQMVLGAFYEVQGIGVSLEAIIVLKAEKSITQHEPY